MINSIIDERYEIQKTLKYIKSNKHKLTPQQWRVLKGQCLSGDVEGAKKGFKKILDRR